MASYRFDLYVVLIVMGIIQGLILGTVFLIKSRRDQEMYVGLFLLGFSILLIDIGLNYTGYMYHVVWFNNFTEWVNFLLGPLFFLYFKASLEEAPLKKNWGHFAFSGLFFLYLILYLVQPNEIKLQDFYGSYYPHLADYSNYNPTFNFDPIGIRNYVNELTIISMFIYAIATAILLFGKKHSGNSKVKSLRWFWTLFLLAIAIIISVKLTFGRDLGDHIIAAYLAIVIYITDYFFVRRFMIEKPDGERYQKSTLSESQKNSIESRLLDLMNNEQYYLSGNPSLSDLAGKVGTSTHYLSQVLNERLTKTFFELIAEYRIKHACRLLKDPSKANYTVEQIAFEVGYNSKSAFNKSFKKHNGMTPVEYRNS